MFCIVFSATGRSPKMGEFCEGLNVLYHKIIIVKFVNNTEINEDWRLT